MTSFLYLLLLLPSSLCQFLQAFESSAKLLSPRSDVACVFDGEETVYIFGGLHFTENWELISYADIHAFNVRTDRIQVIGQLPRTVHGGGAVYRRERNDILYLRADGTFLWSFNPATLNTSSITEWLGPSSSSTIAFTTRDQVYTFGGLSTSRSVYRYDIASNVQGEVGQLSHSSEASVGIHIQEYSKTFLFAGELGDRDPKLLVYDHSKNVTTMLNMTFPSWRHGDGNMVFDGNFVYLVGALVDNGARGNAFLRWDPIGTFSQPAFVRVEGLADLLTWTCPVYVKSMHRIYLIGGYDDRNVDRDQIWFVNL